MACKKKPPKTISTVPRKVPPKATTMAKNLFRESFVIIGLIAISSAADKGIQVGCFKRSPHDFNKQHASVGDCFDFCARQFYRFAVLYDDRCSCENKLQANEEEGTKCDRLCLNDKEEVKCGGSETESVYETGSRSPGPVRNLKILDTAQEKITISFDPPERNGTNDLTGYEINASVRRTYSNSPWALRNQTWKAQRTAQKFDLSNLLPATEYSIFIMSQNGKSRYRFTYQLAFIC